MITISRRLARQLRSVFRSALNLSRNGTGPPIHFRADADALTVRARMHDAAVEYRAAGAHPTAAFAVPFEALKACDGAREDPVHLELQGDSSVVLQWEDGGIPQTARFDRLAVEDDLPAPPSRMRSNDPRLMMALRDAAGSADREATRYALGCIQLQGGCGRIVATDSQQLLVQSGFDFPWTGDLLIPARPVFASRCLLTAQSMEVGRTDDWIAIRSGPWTVWLAIEQDAHFPEVDPHVPQPERASTTLRLSQADAEFLVKSISRLPGGDEPSAPVTLDLNGGATIRVRSDDQPMPMELVLSNTVCSGKRIRCHLDRTFLLRAARLGFREMFLYGPESPVLCQDESRSFVWALLEPEGALNPELTAVRIVSPSRDVPTSSHNPRRERKRPNMPRKAPEKNGHPHRADSRTTDEPTTPIDRVEVLKGTLMQALSQVRELQADLKRQKKQSRLVENALVTLRQLGGQVEAS